MSLKITGRVIDILEEQSGTGRNGPWRKQDFNLETEGEYPAQVCVTDVKAWRVEREETESGPGAPGDGSPPPPVEEDADADLPF